MIVSADYLSTGRVRRREWRSLAESVVSSRYPVFQQTLTRRRFGKRSHLADFDSETALMLRQSKCYRLRALLPYAKESSRFAAIGIGLTFPCEPERPLADIIPEVHFLWKQAIARRLSNVQRPGQTLSGGLDSRAILAEASPQAPGWTAITYGVAGCDDARYARRAAAQVGATWVFHPLYSGQNPDWLERRTDYIQPTDGLIDLTDLMHLEALPLQAQLLDVHLSGYIGDAVSGPTFNHVTTPEDVLISLPWYHTSVGKDWHTALTQVRALMAPLAAAPARFALFDHKLSQSTNRWTVAWRPWLRVRKPFVDYAFFDFCQGLPAEVRGQHRLYEQWLRTLYPQCFATVPHQKTGLPILAPWWQIRLEQGRRVAWRTVQPWLANLGFPARPRIRSYHDDATFWRTPEARARIEGTILRRDSLCCDILGAGGSECGGERLVRSARGTDTGDWCTLCL